MIQILKDNKNKLQEALRLHQAGNLTEAASIYNNLLRHQSEDVDANFLMGTLNLQQGSLDMAAVFLRKVITLKPDHVAAHNNLGAVLQSQGKLSEAIAIYNRIIKLEPEYVDARINLGNVFQEQGKFNEAIDCYKRAIALKPDHAEAHFNLGNALKNESRLDEAIESYSRAIEINPSYAEAHNNLGIVLQEQNKLNEAISCFSKAVSLKPEYAEAYSNLGNVLQEQGKLNEAITNYSKVLEIKPDHAEVHNNIGTVFKEKSKLEEAEASFRQAIEVRPDFAEAHNNLGTVFQEQNKFNDAIVCYRKAISLRPEYAEAYSNLGMVFKEQHKFNEALESLSQAISIRPDYAEAHYLLGIILREQEKPDDALASYRRAIKLKPDYAEAHSSIGTIFHEQLKLNEAVTKYNESIALKPDYVEAHFNRSLVLLLKGNFKDGWSEYEWRLLTRNCSSHTYQQPRWDGLPLHGKSILVHAEQGFGDTIQFVRYLPMVKAKGGYVIFECQNELFRLLKDCSGTDTIIRKTTNNEIYTEFDTHVPLLSLPGIFETTLDNIPSNVPYIQIDSSLEYQWKTKLSHDDNFKIGIVWSGNPTHTFNCNRSCSLNDFTALSDIPGLSFYSLQKGPASAEMHDPPKDMRIIDLGGKLGDFADTAAVISNLDLIISVDTAVAHLAGAIGKHVWNLQSYMPDWRWLLGRCDSPWYPSMRLFRQTQPDNWKRVFEQVKKALLYKFDKEGKRSEGKKLEAGNNKT